jgi:hypothetical protein
MQARRRHPQQQRQNAGPQCQQLLYVVLILVVCGACLIVNTAWTLHKVDRHGDLDQHQNVARRGMPIRAAHPQQVHLVQHNEAQPQQQHDAEAVSSRKGDLPGPGAGVDLKRATEQAKRVASLPGFKEGAEPKNAQETLPAYDSSQKDAVTASLGGITKKTGGSNKKLGSSSSSSDAAAAAAKVAAAADGKGGNSKQAKGQGKGPDEPSTVIVPTLSTTGAQNAPRHPYPLWWMAPIWSGTGYSSGGWAAVGG